ncbi:MAG: AI-2E family transporter [Chloroflexi bacterium]|nr:AI-2E family transporter [Chloroflexota bacterium]
MNTHSKLVRLLQVLAIVALVIFIAERLWLLGTALGSIISMIAVSWLLGLIVRPSIEYLRGGLIPRFVLRWAGRRYGESVQQRLGRLRLPFGVAVAIVYLLLLVVIVGGLWYATASILPQAIDLVRRLPEIGADLPRVLAEAWQSIAPRIGVYPDSIAVNQLISPQDLSTRAAEVAGWLATQAVNLAAVTAGALGQVFLVLILSLYVVAEDRLIDGQFYTLLPSHWHEVMRQMTSSINRSFKSYLRTQMISALLHGAAALIVFMIFRLNFGVVVALLFAVLSVVPLVGIPAAILIAGVVTLLSAPDAVIPVVVILLVIDQIIAYGVVPKLMTSSTGVPSLIAMLSLFVGVQLLGFWGLVFSVPIVGSVYSILFDILLPWRRREENAANQAPS